MKKMMKDKSFWLILVISIVTLIALIVGVIFLTRQNSREFYSAGYIINSTASKSDKYYFSDKTVYKENVFNEYVFKDVDNKEVSTAKDNFIHYLDNSLSFMKNGVILDLDNFNQNIAPYYNITDKSIIKYNNGGYYIETADKTLVFGNFLGRITDNKYIVVGNDISVKLAGNDKPVEGSYFEILFVEDGIVKIENQEGSYQTISEGTVIYIGDNIKIDLGDKSLNYGEEAKLNLTELTIDGNENIDIVPEEELVDKGEKPEDGAGNGNETDTGNNIGEDSGNREPDEGNNEENDKPNGETNTVLKKEVAVNLIDAETTVNSIKAKFQVIDTMEAIKGNLVLTIVNTTTGDTVYTKLLSNTPEEQLISVSALDSNCNYVMKIVDETNEVSTQYFQKSFRTKSLDLILKREMVAEDSLTYYLDFGANSDVTKATVSIYTKDNLDVPFKYHVVEKENNSSVTFDGLTNNTEYVIKVHKVYIETTPDRKYESTTSDITLKNPPKLGNIFVKTNNDAKVFTLMSDAADDKDNAIVKYTYQIFEGVTLDNQDTIKPIYSFDRKEHNDETLKIGEVTDRDGNVINLKGNTDYWFRLVAQYYDNYRYNEVKTTLSAPFNVIGLPTISFEPDVVDINRISGYVVINDEGCTVPFVGRECYDQPNNFVIRISGGEENVLDSEIIPNVVADGKKQRLYFEATGLEAGQRYAFEVYATVDKKNGEKPITNYPMGGFFQTTANINALKVVSWKPNEYSDDNPVSMSASIISSNPQDQSYKNLSKITFNLYEGDVEKYIDDPELKPIATFTDTENVVDKYYNKNFSIDFSMFKYDESLVNPGSTSNVDILRDLSGGKLAEYYTIEITDAYDAYTSRYDIVPGTGVEKYEMPKFVLIKENVLEPTIEVKEITNEMIGSDKYKDYGLNVVEELKADNSVRGYEVTARFDKEEIERIIKNNNAISSVNFYVKDVNSGYEFEPTIVENVDTDEVTTIFFLKDGTDYHIDDNVMTRGNTYSFAIDLSINDGSVKLFPEKKVVDKDEWTSLKVKPVIRYYVENSSEESITYKYRFVDYDKALYSEEEKYYIHYKVNGSEEEFEPVEYIVDENYNMFTLNGLSNGVIYDFGYKYALDKGNDSVTQKNVSYYFDGYYDLRNEFKYSLNPKENSNELQIVIENSEFSDRISAYLLTLSVDGISKKYQKVISKLDDCNDKKCIVFNYKDVNTQDYPFKGKNINVKLEAFYDTGFVGFGQSSLLGDYFNNLGYVSEENAPKVGFVYQTNGVSGRGKYFYIENDKFITTDDNGLALDYPRGILGFEFKDTILNTTNLIDDNNKTFVSFDTIKYNNVTVTKSAMLGGINISGIDGITVNPKVLDKISVSGEESFKFTSIIPNVNTKNVKSFINGVVMDIELDLDSDTLKTDYILDDENKYSFYVDVYKCPEGIDCFKQKINDNFEFIKSVKVKYSEHEDFKNVAFYGLDPATSYRYRISADMNISGEPDNVTLFTSEGVPFENAFTTLTKEKILANSGYVGYSLKSFIDYDKNNNRSIYDSRKLSFVTELNSAYKEQLINFNLKYTLSNNNGQEFEYIVLEDDIKNNDFKPKFDFNIADTKSKGDFVFGQDYHELVITAVTTDLNKELELYRNKLIYNGGSNKFGILDAYVNKNQYGYDEKQFTVNYKNESLYDMDNNDYSIKSTITVTDVDKVIKDGVFYVRLQDRFSANMLECAVGDANCKLECDKTYGLNEENEAFDNNCRLTIKIEKIYDENKDTYKIKGSCLEMDNKKYKNVSSCNVTATTGDSYDVVVVFNNLNSNTPYSIVTQAKTYSKNYNRVFLEPNQNVSVSATKYTKSDLGFSLGLDTAIYDAKNKKLNIVFKNSTNVKDYLVGIKYTIVDDVTLKPVISGTKGIVERGADVTKDDKLEYDYLYQEKHPSISIPIDGMSISKTNTITVSYYYNNNGKSDILKFGDGQTHEDYSFESPEE